MLHYWYSLVCLIFTYFSKFEQTWIDESNSITKTPSEPRTNKTRRRYKRKIKHGIFEISWSILLMEILTNLQSVYLQLPPYWKILRGYSIAEKKWLLKLKSMNIDSLGIFCCLRGRNRPNQVEYKDESPDVVLDKQFIGNVLLREWNISVVLSILCYVHFRWTWLCL